jgi:hypothetical protein
VEVPTSCQPLPRPVWSHLEIEPCGDEQMCMSVKDFETWFAYMQDAWTWMRDTEDLCRPLEEID